MSPAGSDTTAPTALIRGSRGSRGSRWSRGSRGFGRRRGSLADDEGNEDDNDEEGGAEDDEAADESSDAEPSKSVPPPSVVGVTDDNGRLRHRCLYSPRLTRFVDDLAELFAGAPPAAALDTVPATPEILDVVASSSSSSPPSSLS